jgi:hypothetical protein
MRYAIAVAPALLLASLAAGCAHKGSAEQGEEARRHTETTGGFSFVPPSGWDTRAFPGLKFKIAVGPAAGGFAPNINVVDESAGVSLEAYVKGNLATMPQLLKQFRLVKQDSFKTAAGMAGMRVITENQQEDKLLRQTFYFFSKGDTKFVVTCSALAEGGERLDPVFEASMKTFRFDKE